MIILNRPTGAVTAILCASALAAFLAGCSGGGQQTAIASVSASQASLAAAGRVVLACYAEASCAAVAPKPQIKVAFDAAYLTVTQAQTAADSGGTPDMNAVTTSLQTLQALVATLPKPAPKA
jgi:hypothetical protein